MADSVPQLQSKVQEGSGVSYHTLRSRYCSSVGRQRTACRSRSWRHIDSSHIGRHARKDHKTFLQLVQTSLVTFWFLYFTYLFALEFITLWRGPLNPTQGRTGPQQLCDLKHQALSSPLHSKRLD